MLERHIIEFCAPTLAGLKTGGMFGYSFIEKEEFFLGLAADNAVLNEKGVYIDVLKMTESRALLYVYRPALLADRFRRREILDLMRAYGYRETSVRENLAVLRERLQTEKEFPHEIGIFLGYPVADVRGFMEQRGSNCKFCGPWKVYSDVDTAKGLFRKFQNCGNVYRKLFSEGKDISKLTISA